LQGEADPNELLDAVEEWTPLQRYLKDAALVEYWLHQPASQDIDELRVTRHAICPFYATLNVTT